MTSIHTGSNNNIVELDMSELIRPIPPVLDMNKVNSMMETMTGKTPPASCGLTSEDLEAGELPPVDVLTFKKSGKPYYFAFGGCHRLRAHDEAGRKKVRCKLVNCSPNTLRLYLGASANKFLDSD
ncbi:Sulfiredoxin [Schizosaccharomyces pombe]|uniref:Sulfiredoxin n=1 Tax=Schizosaccharomyces pombe (strain 972 / ATCC 24843) TaxID=284812 RepID=SRX1_SCHPO|nr:sulfiredoxin [Schizosaccharomyces pombe]Q9URV9.1 RecName: Full=Sulfiredoxin [Schizosaccharomyces pombe 972h-]CAB53718.1 sulfiredoxin [Schizosaccharomyces pombe]|eukprot:NP_595151.1 sulfiredoxin [Schizosaccharomyces pombe]